MASQAISSDDEEKLAAGTSEGGAVDCQRSDWMNSQLKKEKERHPYTCRAQRPQWKCSCSWTVGMRMNCLLHLIHRHAGLSGGRQNRGLQVYLWGGSLASSYELQQVSTYLIRWVELKFSCHVHALPLWAWFSWLCIVLGLTMSLDHGLACGFWTLPWALDWTWTVNFEDFSFALGVLLDFLGLCMWVRVRSWGFTLGAWIFNKVLKNLFYVCGLKQENIREILPLFALNLYLWPQQLCVSVSLIVKIIEI